MHCYRNLGHENDYTPRPSLSNLAHVHVQQAENGELGKLDFLAPARIEIALFDMARFAGLFVEY
jgi:hypothetical protein